MDGLIEVGRIVSAHGVRGWVKIKAFTDPKENIFQYQPWIVRTKHQSEQYQYAQWKQNNAVFIVELKEISTRDQAELLSRSTILVKKNCFPKLEPDEYYWHQLKGCDVLTLVDGSTIKLGVVKSLLETGSNDVLIVTASEGSLDDRERLIPFIPKKFVTKVDTTQRIIQVDWDPNF